MTCISRIAGACLACLHACADILLTLSIYRAISVLGARGGPTYLEYTKSLSSTCSAAQEQEFAHLRWLHSERTPRAAAPFCV